MFHHSIHWIFSVSLLLNILFAPKSTEGDSKESVRQSPPVRDKYDITMEEEESLTEEEEAEQKMFDNEEKKMKKLKEELAKLKLKLMKEL